MERYTPDPESTWRGDPDSDTYYSFLRGRLPRLGDDEVRADVDTARPSFAREVAANPRNNCVWVKWEGADFSTDFGHVRAV
jgi:hypothetical protein